MARGRGGFRNIPSGGRRRSRSPPNHNNDNNNNSNNNNSQQQQQQQNTKPPNQAASTSTFELRRLVTQAFLKFASTELSGLEKDKVMPDIFKASDSAAFYNPVNNETKQTALDRFKSNLQDILKSNDVVEWMMEKASHLVDPQPREQRVPAAPASAPSVRQQQQFQQQQQAPPPYAGGSNSNGIMAFGGGRFNNNNNNNAAAPGAMMMNPNNNNINRFGNNNNMMMMPNNNNTRPQQQQQPPLALLPDPADPKVLLIKDLPEELNEEQNIRITINNRANNNVLKAVVCEPEKNRAICFCFDESQALLLRSFPSGTVFIRAPDAKLVECDATTWKHALIRLRNKVLEQEELAMQEINKLTSEEEGISIEEVKKNQKPMGLAKISKSTTTKTDDVDSASQQQQQQQQQQQAPPQKTPQEEAAIKEVAQLEKQQQDFTQGLEKYEKELSLLESLGDSISMIPGQEERKKVVEGEVAKRKKQLEECGAALDKARQTLDSFDETKKKTTNKQQQDEDSSNNNTESSSSQQQQDNNNNNNNNNTAEEGEAASQEYNAENKREKKFSSSSAAIENPRALLFFSGFPEAWSDNKILALLKYLPQATPLHVWRAPNSTMVCVELQGGASAAANIATFLSYNDFIYCDVRVTRQRPQQ